tara:strand:+ start:516 stop:1247 length:732 start_codon:yes stop_codon:yes gene_type:complete
MINIFRKSKPTLLSLIPKGFVDIHSHILPGIDDGAKDINQSISLILEMKKMGFSKIIGTPHTYPGLYNNTNNTIKESFDELEKKVRGRMKLSYASEYMIDTSLIKKAEEKDMLCLGRNFVLIETSINHEPLSFDNVIFNLQTNGYTPIIAHPERYTYMYNNKKKYFYLADKGCKFQINLLSIVGYYGKSSIHLCDFLLKNNLVDFAGSDLHNIGQIEYFKESVSINYYRKIIKVLENNIENFS